MRAIARVAATTSAALATLAALGVGAAPAAAEAKGGEVLVVECADRVVELRRSNGASLWGAREDGKPGAHYALVSLRVTHEGDVVFAKEWGRRSGFDALLTCTSATEGGFLWEFVVAADPR
ncbi:MAG TPA: hypothetical protein VNA20_14175 [Frankiaceae bacterium]|nr:hypothetical protein [Frankiaceae bacterium]